MAKKKEYNANSLRSLKYPECCQHRPGMYIGSIDEPGVRRIWKEILDNSIDEAQAGHGKRITIIYTSKTNVFIVVDEGRGVPSGYNKAEKKTGFELVFATLHGSGKFDQSNYESSSGLNGVGASVTNALSESFQVWSHNEKRWRTQSFRNGVAVGQVKDSAPEKEFAKLKRGTVVTWKPSDKVFGKARIDTVLMRDTCKHLAMLNPGLEIIVIIDGKKKTYRSENGILDMIFDDEQKKITLGKPFHYQKTGVLDIAVTWQDDAENATFSYVNSSHTPEEGTHVQGARNAIIEALRAEMPDPKKKPVGKRTRKSTGSETLDPKNMLKGMRLALNFRMANPVYSGQTKDKLSNAEVVTQVKNLVLPEFSKFLKANPKFVSLVLDRAKKFQKLDEKFSNDLKAVKSITLASPSARGLLPGKLAQATGKYRPDEIELFLVEGDSAAGPCFSGNTKVRLLNGEAKTFKQLVKDAKAGKKNYGYAYDLEKERSVVVELEAPRKTDTVSDVVDVTLSNGTTVTCTPNHLWLLRDGTYKKAEDLTEDDELMPHTEYIDDGRRYIVSPRFSVNGNPSKRGARDAVYILSSRLNPDTKKQIARIKKSGDTPQVHHEDHDRSNDLPDNLVVIAQAEHLREHEADVPHVSGADNAHAVRMRNDPHYRARSIATTKRWARTFWKNDENRQAASTRTTKHFKDPKNRERQRTLSRSVVIERYKRIVALCGANYTQASFERARAKLAKELGVQKLNIGFDYWKKIHTGTLASFIRSCK